MLRARHKTKKLADTLAALSEACYQGHSDSDNVIMFVRFKDLPPPEFSISSSISYLLKHSDNTIIGTNRNYTHLAFNKTEETTLG